MNEKAYVFFIVLILSGCSAAKHLEQGSEVSNSYFSILWNTATWDFARSEEKMNVTLTHGRGGDEESMIFDIYSPTHRYKHDYARILLRGQAYLEENEGSPFLPGSEMFFDKSTDYGRVLRESDGTPAMMTINHYGLRAYNRKWEKVTYVQGMKCLESVFLRRSQNKVYKIYCGYYDKKKGKRILFVAFDYDSRDIPLSSSGPWGEISKSANIPHIQPFEDKVKQAAKQVISTIQLKNLDRERMEREGLMHYDKKFEISEY